MIYWIFLGMAIVAEITGTLSMKWSSVSENNTGYIFMLVMITLSYILLSFSVKKIALGVAYAMWEGIGILIITVCSVLLFDESISALKILGLTTLVAGIILLKSGTAGKKERKSVASEKRGSHAAV